MRVLPFLLVLVSPLANAQDLSPYLTRFMDHREAVVAFSEQSPPDSLSSPDAAVDYIQALARFVEADVLARDPDAPDALRQLDAYVVHQLGRQMSRAYGEPLPVWCALWSQEMVPRLAADVARFASEPTADHAALVWIPAVANVIGTSLAYRCRASDETWATFETMVERVLTAAPRFLDGAAAADSTEATRLRRSLGATREAEPYIRAERLRRAGDLAAAQAALEPAMQAAPWRSVWAAGRLAESMAAAGETGAALAVLDRAAPLAPPARVPADTVRAWYAAVSAVEAESRFAAATAGPALVATSDRVAWAEGLVDLATGDPFDPASLGDVPVLLDVWATWCANCIAEFPELVRLAEAYEGRVAVVAVSVDLATGGADLDGVRAVAEQHGLDVVSLYDPRESGSLADQLEIAGYPARFFFGPDGQAYASRSGRRPVTKAEVRAYLDGQP